MIFLGETLGQKHIKVFKMEKKIALTGSIASGKSTVANFLRDEGIIIIDADEIAHNIILKTSPAFVPIVETFGYQILGENGEISRSKLRKIVFNDKLNRKTLNEIMHPIIRNVMALQHKQARLDFPNKIIIHDIPLLFETGRFEQYEVIILVTLPEKLQIERLAKRDGISNNSAKKLLSMQISLTEKQKFATYIINNSGTKENTRKQIKRLIEKL